jgi:hypothetical protein
MIVRLKVNVQGGAQDEGEVLSKKQGASTSDRYKAVFKNLDLDEKISDTPPSLSSSSSFVLRLAKAAEARGIGVAEKMTCPGSAELSRKAMPRSAIPRKALPVVPELHGGDAHKKYLVYEGRPGRVSSVVQRVGNYVLFGSEMITVDVAGDEEDEGEDVDAGGESKVGYSNMYHEDLELGGYGYSTDAQLYSSSGTNLYSDSRLPNAETRKTGDEKKDGHQQVLETVCWNVKEPGVMIELLVNVSDLVSVGDRLCLVDCSHPQQQLAYLAAADEIKFKVSRSIGLNERFQVLVEKLVSDMSSSSSGSSVDTQALLTCCSDLERVVRDFMETARTYGKMIISEIHFPPEQKTIRPLKMGGVLGGAKYVVRGILFKIPDGSMFSAYPDPMFIANKIQGHELKGLKAYFGWFFNRASLGLVSFPLTAIIDYKGYRITAMTLLPISGSETLIYGSDDAGTECNVRNDIPEWSQLIRDASVGLNLKPHYVINGRSAGGEAEIASCVDLEGHNGSDRRYYLLDFSRTFPPLFKKPSETYDKFWPFYNMMRGEFLKRWGKPLSADAFSNFQSVSISEERKSEAKVNQEDVRVATAAIEEKVVVMVCKALFASHDASTSIRHIFHREGLNMRYLGVVYQRLVGDLYQASKHNLYKLVQVEALMRVLKADLRSCLRKAQAEAVSENSESLLLGRAAQVLNQYFGCCDLGAWMKKNGFCLEHLLKKFAFKEKHARIAVSTFVDGAQSVSETFSSGVVVEYSFKYAVLLRLNDAMGLGIDKGLLKELEQGKGFRVRSFASETIFSDADLKFEERVKHLDIVERARGLSEYLQGEDLKTKSASEHLMKAFDIFESALEASPIDPWLSLLMGRICSKMYTLLSGCHSTAEIDTRNLFSERTEFFYRQAFAFEVNCVAYLQLGTFLAKFENRHDEAEDYLLKVLEGSKKGSLVQGQALVELVQLLEKNKKKERSSDLAKELREKTKSFVEYNEQWIDVKSMGSLAGVESSVKGRVSIGRKRGEKERTRVPISPSASGNLFDTSKSKIGNIRKALQRKVGVQKQRKTPVGTQSLIESGNSVIEQEGSLIEGREILSSSSGAASGTDSGRASVIDEDEGMMTPDLVSAMSRNEKLREALLDQNDKQQQDVGGGDEESLVPVIDKEMQTYLQSFMQRQGSKKYPGSGS